MRGDRHAPPIHPGEVLADALAEQSITPTELARQLEVWCGGAVSNYSAFTSFAALGS